MKNWGILKMMLSEDSLISEHLPPLSISLPHSKSNSLSVPVDLPVVRPFIFNVDKPQDWTSQSVVSHFKRNLPRPFGKIGHIGTLDPFCTGVLLVATGGASRISDFIHQFLPKTYLAEGIFGISTPTGDLTKPVTKSDDDLAKRDLAQLTLEELQLKLKNHFQIQGDYWQVPPIYSATKHLGQPLYKWARKGVEIIKEPKLRSIYDINVISYNFPKVVFEVKVSGGTYIRTLFEDIAKLFGTIGVLEKLRRTKVGDISCEEGLQEKDWPKKYQNPDQDKDQVQESPQFNSQKVAIPLEKILPFRMVNVSTQEKLKFLQGQKLSFREEDVKENKFDQSNQLLRDSCQHWVFDEEGKLLGLATKDNQLNTLAPKIVFPSDF
jgi:tRNA pseudouridine55 synthase